MASPRNVNPMRSAPALSDEKHKAVVNAALEALSSWGTDIVSNSDKNIARVINKIAAAVEALGWPEQIVDATRAQMQSISRMQIQMLDQIVNAWEEQIKSPTSSSAILSKLRFSPGSDPATNWLNPDTLQMEAANPLGFYMQFAEQCQKAWANATGFWIKR